MAKPAKDLTIMLDQTSFGMKILYATTRGTFIPDTNSGWSSRSNGQLYKPMPNPVVSAKDVASLQTSCCLHIIFLSETGGAGGFAPAPHNPVHVNSLPPLPLTLPPSPWQINFGERKGRVAWDLNSHHSLICYCTCQWLTSCINKLTGGGDCGAAAGPILWTNWPIIMKV